MDDQEPESTIDRGLTVNVQTNQFEIDDDFSLDQSISIGAPSAEAFNTRVGVQQSAVSFGDNEPTRELLRKRLMIASLLGAVLLVLIKSIGFLFGQLSFFDIVTRLTALSVLLGSYFFLQRRVDASLRTLRRFEVLIFLIPLLEAGWILVMEGNELINDGKPEAVATLFANVSMAITLFIAIYGLLIPSTWKRTLITMGTAALLPTIICLIYVNFQPELSAVDQPGFITPLLTVMMACIATLAAHVVTRFRRQVESFKQYGQYQLVEEIGRGGMGIVYKAKHRVLKRPSAIKLIRSEAANDKQAIDNFEFEVQVSATLSHWNTVQIYDYGRTDDGDFYYVMEYLVGETLQDRIDSMESRPMETPKVIAIMNQVCDGLAEAHNREMVHRDLKPANIFLAQSGGCTDVVKILDFGLAIRASDNQDIKSLSGSPAYMSPEQILLQPINPSSDIYALGCVIFECLVGKRLFSGKSMREVFKNHIEGVNHLGELQQLNPDMAAIVEKCVSKEVTDRFDTVSDLKAAMIDANSSLLRTS
jgi:serine/threonine-protein kinase